MQVHARADLGSLVSCVLLDLNRDPGRGLSSGTLPSRFAGEIKLAVTLDYILDRLLAGSISRHLLISFHIICIVRV